MILEVGRLELDYLRAKLLDDLHDRLAAAARIADSRQAARASEAVAATCGILAKELATLEIIARAQGEAIQGELESGWAAKCLDLVSAVHVEGRRVAVFPQLAERGK